MPTFRVLTLLIVSVTIGFASPALSQTPTPKPTTTLITLDFQKAPLENIVQFYANLMKRNFIVGSEVSGKTITVIAPQPVSLKEAYQVFTTALAMNGLQIIRYGKFYKIVSAKSGEISSPKTQKRATRSEVLSRDGSMETRYVPVHHAPLSDVQNVLSQLSSSDARIIADPRTGALIIVEHKRNMKKLLSVLSALDRPGDAVKAHVHPLQHTNAADISKTLNALDLNTK